MSALIEILAYALLFSCYLLGGIGFSLLVWSRQRAGRLTGALLILMGLLMKILLTAPAIAGFLR